MKKITTFAAKLGFQKEVISHLGTPAANGRPAADAGQTTDGTTTMSTAYCFISNLF